MLTAENCLLMSLAIYTIGHSTHSADAFLGLLAAHSIGAVADVRTIPKSRRHPHFSREAMEEWLGRSGIGYRHFPALGGLRRPNTDSINTAIRHPSFRGYADHMQTPEFVDGVAALETFRGRTSDDGDVRGSPVVAMSPPVARRCAFGTECESSAHFVVGAR